MCLCLSDNVFRLTAAFFLENEVYMQDITVHPKVVGSEKSLH